MKNEVELIFEKLKNKQASLFCGAGISYNSGVPLVKDIKEKILSILPFEVVDHEFLINYSMPFELFMESLIENSLTNKLLEIFEIGTYNTNHLFIANLIKSGYLKTVITTNFDNFIEKALDKLNVIYSTYYEETDFHNIDWNKEEIKIIKIHGSVHDKQNMAITIKKVSNKELVFSRNKVIQNVFEDSKTDSIIIIGYSCSDIFDINPTIKKIPDKNKLIFYFQHDSKSSKDYRVFPISQKSEPNPFLSYNGYIIHGNTDDFIKETWNRTLSSQFIQTFNNIPDWIYIVDEWIEQAKNINGKEVVYYLSGQLLIASANHSKAINYFLKGYDLTIKNRNKSLSIDFLFSIGRTYRDMQKLNEGLQNSLRYLHIGLKKSKKYKFQKKQCSILLSLGVTYEDKKDHNSAIKYVNRQQKVY